MDALTAFGPAGAAVVIVALFLKFIRDEGEKRDKVISHLAKESQLTRKAITENTQFMRNLNGELKKAAQKKLEVL